MAFCSKCGNEATGRENHCSFCGFPLLDEAQVSAVAQGVGGTTGALSGLPDSADSTAVPPRYPAGGLERSPDGRPTGLMESIDARGDIATFIGKNAVIYLDKFGKFNDGARDSYAFTWHWPAFLFPMWWFLYRKMYLWAAMALMAEMLFGIFASIALALTANYIYYKHATTKIREVRANRQANPKAVLTLIGGVHAWVIPLALVLGFIGFGLIFAAILLASLMGPSVPVGATSI